MFLNHEASCFFYEQDKAEKEVNKIRAAGQTAWYQSIQEGKEVVVEEVNRGIYLGLTTLGQ